MNGYRGTLHVLLAAACGTLAGCTANTDITAGERAVEVRTSSRDYFIGAAIAVVIDNATDDGVAVAHCNQRVSLMVQRRVGDDWEDYRQSNGPLCNSIYPMGDLLIEPGGELAETLQLDEAGEFRLRLYARFVYQDFGSLVVISRPFTVRYPPD